jgi:hypothetical protein
MIDRFGPRIALAAALICGGAGCGMLGAGQSAPSPAPQTAGGHVTNLASLSSQPAVIGTGTREALSAADALHLGPGAKNSSSVAETGAAVRHVGTEFNPGVERLLNRKAKRFPTFCAAMLDRLFARVRKRETDYSIATLKLPDNLQSTIIVATLDRSGKLKELVLEQHSGKGIVDRLFINACKESLSAPNPPADALTPDGVYKVRIDAKLENYATLGGGRWNFKAILGIALL